MARVAAACARLSAFGPWGWAICLVSSLVVLPAWAIWYASPTIDEPSHLAAGLSNWSLGRFDLYKVNPPLVRMVAAAPVCWMEPKTDWRHARPESPGHRVEFDVGPAFVRQNADRIVSMFRVARTACLPFLWLGAGTCFWWGRALYGRRAGLLAAGLWAFSPMVLGHGTLITSDVAAASTGALAVYRFRSWLNETTLWNAVLLGSAAGVALLTKFTWLVIFPLTVVIVLPVWRGRRYVRSSKFISDLKHLGVAALVALYLINALYGFEGTGTALGEVAFVSEALRSRTEDGDRRPSNSSPGEDHANRFSGHWMGRLPLPLPRSYVQGIDVQQSDFDSAHQRRSFLMGEWSVGGFTHYYFVGLLVKSPLAVLILAIGACVVHMKLHWSRWLTHSPETSSVADSHAQVNPRETFLLIVPAVLVFGLVTCKSQFAEHFRYLLPAYAFAFIFISSVSTCCRGPAGSGGLTVLLVWQAASVLATGPCWIGYFNEAVGGWRKGPEWMLHSSVDWGQDLLELKRWHERHPGVNHLHVAAISMFEPTHLGLEYTIPPPLCHDRPNETTEDGRRGPQEGWHAVSVSLINGQSWRVWDGRGRRRSIGDCYGYFGHVQPCDYVGTSIYIFHLSERDASQLRTLLQTR